MLSSPVPRLRLLLAACASLLAPAAFAKPNILFIFADDMTHDAIAALGNDEIETPALDRLVRAGTTFTHAYNSGSWSGAVCVASRHMLMTGRQLWHAQKIANDKRAMADLLANGRFWPQLLERAGYQTYMTGKWHVNADAAKVFNVARHVRPGMPKTVRESYNRPLEGKPDPWDPADKSIGGFWEGGTHWSEVQADDAIGFLRDARNTGQPFFIYLAFNAPHDPRQAPQEFLDKYPADRIEVPPSFQPRYPYCDEIGCAHSLRDENLAPMPRTKHAVQVHRREYYALITHMDAQIGRVLDELESTDAREDTYIVFTADHGLAVGKHGLFGKQNMYDHSVRVPFVVVGPGVPKNKRIQAPVYLQDVVPTTLDWAGAPTPDELEFESVQPLLDGSGKPRPYIYGAYLDKQRAIIADGYKLIAYPQAGNAMRLYHVAEDPHELTDLLQRGDLAARAMAMELFKLIVNGQPEFGDTLKLTPP